MKVEQSTQTEEESVFDWKARAEDLHQSLENYSKL